MKKIILIMMTGISLAFLMSCTPKYEEPNSESDLFQNGLLAVCEVDGQCGYINESGKVEIDLNYEHTSKFSYGYAAVSSAGKWGIIDTRGREIIPIEYDYAASFANLGFMMYANKYSSLDSYYEPFEYIDLQGKSLSESEVYELRGYEDSMLVMKHDFLDSGEYTDFYFQRISDDSIVIEGFESAVKEAYSESNIVCFHERTDCHLIDENGNYLTEFGYTNPILAYGDEMYSVMSGSKRGVINGQGEVIVPFEYDSFIRFNDDGVALIKIGRGSTGDHYGLVNTEGVILVEPDYYLGNEQDVHLSGFSGTMYNLYNDEKEFLFNLKGELIFESFDNITSWTDSYFITYDREDSLFSVFDASGDPIFTDAAIIRKLNNQLFWMKQSQEDDYAYYDHQGTVIFQSPNPESEYPAEFTNHSEETFYLIYDGDPDLMNLYNTTGEVIASIPQSVSVEIFADGYIVLTDMENQGLISIIDFTGSLILDYQYELFSLNR